VPIRFFVDENDLALGRALAETNPEVVYPGHPDLPEVPRGSLDDEWLPVIGRRGLVVITRDSRIRYRRVEKDRWVAFGVRGFILTGRRSQSTSDSLALLAMVGHHREDGGPAADRAMDVLGDHQSSASNRSGG